MMLKEKINAICGCNQSKSRCLLILLDSGPRKGNKQREGLLTVLPWIQAQVRPIQDCCVLANIPDVEVKKDWDGGESCDPEPSQHEDVGQHDELKEEWRATIIHYLHF